MRRLSRKTQYALQALGVFSRRGTDPRLNAASLAKRSGAPAKFLEAILLRLTHAGILESKKGKGGGYGLAEPADQITVGQVIRAIDGPGEPLPCLRRVWPARCEDCPDDLPTCVVRLVLLKIRDAASGVLDAVTVGDLAGNASSD
jgi:Rrf2 family protein